MGGEPDRLIDESTDLLATRVSPLSSGVEHVLGKDGVASSTLAEGSI